MPSMESLKSPLVQITGYGFGYFRVALDCGAVYEMDNVGKPLFLDRLGWYPIEEKLSHSYNVFETVFIIAALKDLHVRMHESLKQVAHISQVNPLIESFNGPLW